MLPRDPMILLSYVNLKLRDFYPDLDSFCAGECVDTDYILDKLEFEVLAPTMMEYFKLFASFLNLSEEKINHGFYVLNIVLVDFHMLEFPNFMLALAVLKLITKKINKNLINLIRNILKENKIDKFLKMVENDDYEDILDICDKIKILYDTFLETKYKNIQNKFAENKFNCVSNNTTI
jgi:hypothetical protein